MYRATMAAMVGTAIAMVGAPLAGADDGNFKSPSGNIGCVAWGDELRCDIDQRNWSPPPRPASCDDHTDWGPGIRLHTTGTAQFVCAGDSVMGPGPVLQYGQFWAGGGMSCNSERSGFRCSNSDGHGFTLSREAYTLF